MKINGDSATVAVFTRLVQASNRYSWFVILGFLLLAVASSNYVTRHFAITTDINQLISPDLPWRHREVTFAATFPHRDILAVVDAPTRTGKFGRRSGSL